MHLAAEGLFWENVLQAPSLNYRMQAEGGSYQIWMLLAETELALGEHMLTVYAVASGIRVDRIFLTRGESVPPIDVEWREDG